MTINATYGYACFTLVGLITTTTGTTEENFTLTSNRVCKWWHDARGDQHKRKHEEPRGNKRKFTDNSVSYAALWQFGKYFSPYFFLVYQLSTCWALSKEHFLDFVTQFSGVFIFFLWVLSLLTSGTFLWSTWISLFWIRLQHEFYNAVPLLYCCTLHAAI